jgi:hypothetical protein
MSIEKSNDLIGNRTRDHSACSIVPQPTTLPRAPAVDESGSYSPHGSHVYLTVRLGLHIINTLAIRTRMSRVVTVMHT